MTGTQLIVDCVVVDEAIFFNLQDLCRVCRAAPSVLVALVDEGVLAPIGDGPDNWQFAGPTLRRVRTALRLQHDLELTVGATALVLDLTDRIEALEAVLRRNGLA